MSSSSLPRGIQAVTWTNADGTKAHRYRVRIQRKNFKRDELFTDLAEAKQLLAMSKTSGGRATLENQSVETATAVTHIIKKHVEDFAHKSRLRDVLQQFKEETIDTLDTSTHENTRKKTNLTSFINTLARTEIEHTTEAFERSFIQRQNKSQLQRLSNIKLENFSEYDVNAYIATRLKAGRKSATINRELSILSQAFEHCRASNKALKGLANPVSLRNKRLLRARGDRKAKARLSEDDKIALYAAIENYSNPELAQICKLSLATAMRRSEIINLTWPQVKGTYIELTKTKTTPRQVHLTEEAQELFIDFPKSTGRIFQSYKNASSFEGSFKKLMERKGLAHITFHIFRKEAFSNFFEQLGTEKATILSEFLGVKSVRKFKELHAPAPQPTLGTEVGIMRSGGHSNPQTLKDHYLVLKK